MLSFNLVYHERYDLNLGAHVFPSQKFRLIAEALLRENIAAQKDFLCPDAASDEDILRVHTPDWVRKLKTGTLSASEIMRLEVPYSKELVVAVWLAAGERFWQRSARCGMDSEPISVAVFTTRIRGLARVFARFTMWLWRSGDCRLMAQL